ncbi:MAG: endolytic transglycosylase MltG [Parcubacteria group bacterium]|nr:endolytic transglycosylase MltG [Parcubacteria group bacterium]
MLGRICLFLFFSISFVILGTAVLTGYFIYTLYQPAAREKREVVFEITQGESLEKMTQNLEQVQLIRSVWVFKSYIYLIGGEKLQAGKHTVHTQMNIVELARELMKPATLGLEREIRILEGWNFDEIGWYLEKAGVLDHDSFVQLAKRPSQSILKRYPDLFADFENGSTLEGYLFPDTYRIFTNASAEGIILKMLDNLASKLKPELLAAIRQKGASLHEILTLASIVEKEVKTAQDRRLVADIFYKRLRKGMPLQADSTINYFTQKGADRASYDDIAVDNPYNTYKYIGLPPGPISNPGLDAIKAAIFPEKNPYYFFLTSRDGTVYYAKTFEEHKNNRRYLE